MDRIEELFPNYDASGRDIIRKAYEIAEKALTDQQRSNGKPFLEHPVGVAKIASEEIGLPAECIAAVFLHEAMRFNGKARFRKGYPYYGGRTEQYFIHQTQGHQA